MISWTETASYTALTSESSHSAFDEESLSGFFGVAHSAQGETTGSTSADADGASYVTQSGSGSSEEFVGGPGTLTITTGQLYHFTFLPNGAATTMASFSSSTNFSGPDPSQNSITTETSEVRQGSSSTRSSQTTTTTTASSIASITRTTAVSGTVAATTLGSGSTVPTIRFTQSASTLTAATTTQSSKEITRTTSLSSTYTNYGTFLNAFAGVGRRTNIMPEPNEVIWVMTTTASAAAELTAIATSYTNSFSLSPITFITARPASITTAFYEVSEEATELTMATTARSGVSQTRAFLQNNRFPMQTYLDIRNTETTVSTNVGSSERSVVFGSSTTRPDVGDTTMTGRFGGLTYHQEYKTTTTQSKFTEGLTLLEESNSYSTAYSTTSRIGFYDGSVSITESSEGSATLEGSVETWGVAIIGDSNSASAVETCLTDGYAILTNATEPATLLGLSPALSVFMPVSTNRAWPRIVAPQLGSNSLGISTSGSSTWSYDQIGVTQTSVGTASDATAVTTSASWTQEGAAGTAQFDDRAGAPGAGVGFLGTLRTPATTFSSFQGLQRIGGVPATGASNISALVPPGKYLTATGSDSAFVTYNHPTTLQGTVQTAIIPCPLFVALENPSAAPSFTVSRNLLPYSSQFFPL